MSDLAVRDDTAEIMERVLLVGDLAKLTPQDRVAYYLKFCASIDLNPLTRPFDFLKTPEGEMVLYANKDASEQLRKKHGVSVTKIETALYGDIYVVTAYAKDKDGREDVATGAVDLGSAKGQRRADLMMKAETKAKRRVTLSICGLGVLDETEVDFGKKVKVDLTTGEIEEPLSEQPLPPDHESERQELLQSVRRIADQKKLYGSQRRELWDAHIGKDVLPQAATIDQLIALRDAIEKA